MSLKSTSLNISACVSSLLSLKTTGNLLRTSLLKYFAVILLFFVGGQFLQAQCPNTGNPPVAVCVPLGTVTGVVVPPDGSALTLNPVDFDGGSTDDCPGATLSVSPATVSCADLGGALSATIPVTLTITDGEGLSANCVTDVEIVDAGSPPSVVCQDITVNVGAGAVTVFPADIDGGSFSCITVTAMTIDGGASVMYDCADIGSTTAELAWTNANGTSTCMANVTIEDATAPTAVCNDITVSLDASGNYTLSGANMAAIGAGSTDLCDASLTYSVSPSSFTCADVGGNAVTLTVTDDGGNSDTCPATVTVEDNTDPVAVCQDITVSLDQSGSYTLTAAEIDGGSTDACGIASISIPPTTFSCADLGPNSVTLTVTDNNSNTDMCSATVTVVDMASPVIANCPPLSAAGSMTGDTIYAVTNSGTCETTVGWITPTPGDACSGIGSFTATAIDDGGNPIVLFTGGTPPTPPCTDIILFSGYYDVSNWSSIGTVDVSGAPASIELMEGSSFTRTVEYDGVISFDWVKTFGGGDFSYGLNGSFVDVSTILPPTSGNIEITVSAGDVFSFVQGSGAFTAEAIISNFAFSCAEGTFGTFPEGTSTVTYMATDGLGNTETCIFYVVVTDEEPPTIGAIAGQSLNLSTLDCDNPMVPDYTGLAVTADNCGVASVTQEDLAPGDAVPAITHGSTFDVDMFATDVNGNNSDTITFTVTINDNVPPTVNTCPSPIVVQIPDDNNGSTCTATATWTAPTFDDCGDGDGSGDAFAGTFISRSDGNAENDPFALADSPVTVTYRYTDGGGNSVDCAFTVTVLDNEGPQFSPVPPDLNANVDPGECFATVTWGAFSAVDCTPPVTFSSSHNSGDQFPVGTTVVTVTATDGVGNNRVTTFEVRVSDDEAPTAICQDITVNLDATGTVTINTGDIDNGSSDNCGIASFAFSTMGGGGPFCDEAQPGTGFPSDPACEASICAVDPFCCSINWDGICASAAATDPACSGCLMSAGGGTTNTLTFDCTNIGPNTVTLNVTDDSGNTATCNATVTVVDNITPTITCPADITVNAVGGCDAVVSVPAPVIGDNCSATATNDYNGTADASDTYPTGTTLVTWTVSDGNGNSTTCTMNVTVQDNEDPSLTCPTGSAVQDAVASGSTAVAATIDEDDCVNTQLDASISISGIPVGANIDSVTLSLDVTHFWIGDLTAELITPGGTILQLFTRPGTPDADCSTFSSFGCSGDNILATFSDNGSTLAESQCNFPFPSMSGALLPVDAFSSVYGENLNGSWTLRIRDAFDDNFPGTLNAATIDVYHNFLVASSNLERSTNTGLCDYTAVGTEFDPANFGDNCPGTVITHNYPLAPNPNTLDGAVFPVGQTNITWTATDASGNTTTCNIAIIVVDDEFPVQTGGQADGSTISVNAMGGGCTATVNWIAPTFDDNCVSPLIPNSTHTPGSTFPVGTHHVEYTAMDPSGNTTVVSFTVIVMDGIPPVAGCQPNPINLFLDGTGNVTLNALDVNLGSFDNCAIDSYLISINGGPFAPSHSFDCMQLGTYTVTLRISDGTLTDDCTATVIVSDNIPPTAVCQDITVNLDANGNATISIQQVDNGSSDNGLACLGLSLSNTTFDCSDLGLNTVTLTVSDAGGNTDACTANVTVVDNVPPVLGGIIPPDVTVGCNVTLPGDPGTVTATDNCDIPVVVYSESSTQSGNPANCANYTYTFTQTWTASDNSSNSASVSRVITVQDNVAPGDPVYNATMGNGSTISTNPNDCFATVTLQLTDLDDCAPFANITVTNDGAQGNGTTSASGNYPIGTHTITFTATDPCGNTASFTYTFTVVDNIPPVSSCVNNLNLGLPSSGILILSPNAIDNNSYDNCGVITLMEVSPDTFDCSDVGMTIPVTLTVYDDAGNSSSCNTSVTIQENNNPTALCQPVTLTLDGNGMASLDASQVDAGSFDDCTPVTLSVSPNAFDQDDLGTNTVTLTVTDDHGNSSTCLALVTVVLPPTCFHIGDVAGGAGNVVSVPITTEDFTGLLGFQFIMNIMSDQDSINWDSIGEFVGVSGIHPDISNLLESNLLADSVFTPIDTSYLDELDGMGNPIYPPLDSIDMITYDTMLFYNNMSVSWVQFNPSGPITLPDNTVLFYADILLTGNLDDNSVIKIVDPTPLTPPEITQSFGGNLYPGVPCWTNGSIEIGELIISGNIHNEYGHNIALVDVNLFNTPSSIPGNFIDDYETATDGNYFFTVISGGNFDIDPEKTINWPNGIDILDVASIQRHAVNFAYVNSAYKKIAADVSGDRFITTFDAVQLNLYLSGGFTGPPPPTSSWQFVDATQVLPNDPNATVPPFDSIIILLNVISDSPDNDFIAVKTGDIAGLMADTAAIIDNEADHFADTDLQFIMNEQAVKANESYSFEVRANNFDQLIGYQWVLNFDDEVLTYTGFENGMLVNLGNGNFGDVFVKDGQLILTWYNAYATDVKADEVLFKLNFTAKQDAGRLSSLLSVAELPQLKAVAYNEGEVPRSIDLTFEIQEDKPGEFALYQNIPNPFKDETVISFNLPESTFATLRIMDVAGKVIYQTARTFDQGYNEVNISKSDIPVSGTLFYELTTPEQTASRQMIVIE